LNGADFVLQTLESDQFVCVRQKLNEEDKPQVIIVDLKKNNEVIQRPINADSAIMHWSKQVIALKAQSRTVQIFDLAAKAKLKSAVMNEDVVFWKWFSETSLGLVTDSSVYHWNVFDPTQNAPVKMFDRNQNLAVCRAALNKETSKLTTFSHRAARSSTIELTMTKSGLLSWAFRRRRDEWRGPCSSGLATVACLSTLKVMPQLSVL
jgi:hypothetical protein